MKSEEISITDSFDSCLDRLKQSSSMAKRYKTKGQSTVEYAVVFFGILAIILAFGLLCSKLKDGYVVEKTADNASHAITKNTAGSIGDIILY